MSAPVFPPVSPSSPASPRALLCVNANAVTLDPARPRASVLAVRGARFVYVGDDEGQAAALLSSPDKGSNGDMRPERLDMEGKTVVPGLSDCHAHMFAEGQRLGRLDVGRRSRRDALELVRQAALERPAGEWIVGEGWDQAFWRMKSWPSLEDLDSVAPNHPVVLFRVDQHSLWYNSRAAEAAGLTADTPCPDGGEILKNSEGGLAGILVGAAMWSIFSAMPPASDAAQYQAFLAAQDEMLGFGITSVTEAGISVRQWDMLNRAAKAGDLNIRVHALLMALDRQDTAYFRRGGEKQIGLHGDLLSLAGVKIHADGSLGSRSAWLLEDYADQPGHRGAPFCSGRRMLAVMKRAREHGMQIAVHAIGDAAFRRVVDAMEKVLGPEPGDHRWRIEHVQVAEREDLARAMRLGVVPSVQTACLASDIGMAEARLGERAASAYAWRDMLNLRGLLINGSDCPVECPNPFEGIRAAVTRQNRSALPEDGWYPAQRLTREEALKSYTLWPAYAEFNEDKKGSLQAGKLADFAVLDRDILACAEEKISETRVLATFVNGREVWRRQV